MIRPLGSQPPAGLSNPSLSKLKLRETNFHGVSNSQLHGKRHPQRFEFGTSISYCGSGSGCGSGAGAVETWPNWAGVYLRNLRLTQGWTCIPTISTPAPRQHLFTLERQKSAKKCHFWEFFNMVRKIVYINCIHLHFTLARPSLPLIALRVQHLVPKPISFPFFPRRLFIMLATIGFCLWSFFLFFRQSPFWFFSFLDREVVFVFFSL
jgi:hypothetical protein